ncbi:MAG TPA: RluA family pseudouridine synthase [Elusimicrobiota bacterium]|nr:RluA family pseudouridine synthase [Elusimicrobiota bacterium]
MTEAAWVDVSYRAGAEHAGWRADVFLRAKMKRRSRGEIQEWMERGQVFRGGRALKPADRVRAQDEVLVRFARREDPPARFQSLPVVYEDECLLAVNKPGRLLSHPTDKVRRDSVTEILAAHFSGARPHLVHRLDRETSGLLVLAKTKQAAKNLTDQFVSRGVKKRYLALARGRVPWREKLAEAPLSRAGGEIWVRQEVRAGGVAAVTRFRRLALGEAASLVSAEPKTGRLHQIRAHLSWLGYPVLGDKLYQDGGRAYLKMTRGQIADEDLEALGGARQMLHSWALELRHPVGGEILRLRAPLPEDFALAAKARGIICPE